MAKRTKPSDPAASAPPPTPSDRPFTTTQYGDVRRLHAAGILARTTYGQPLVFEYAPEDTVRIREVLG